MLTVMTGGTKGLGRVAAERLAALGDRERIMGVRHQSDAPAGWQTAPLDLASLSSVRQFAAALPDMPVSRLILNAGGQHATANERTPDGFESTFAANHLAHYLLLRLLMPRLANGATIVITSSGTHDPAEKTGMPAPRHANAGWLAHPENDPELDGIGAVAGMRAYSNSKLCNLLTARALAASDMAKAGNWRVYAYDPGLTPGTGLIRHQPWIVRALIWPLLPLFVPFAAGMNSLADAGRGLFELATTATGPDRAVYATLRKGKLTWPAPSVLAQDDAVMQALWHDSGHMAGLEPG